MKYNLLLLSVITSSILTSMEIKRASSQSKKTLTDRKKTTIFISRAMYKNRNIFITLDHNDVLSMNSKTKGPHRSSPSKNKLNCYELVT
jgi:hypothetical protein